MRNIYIYVCVCVYIFVLYIFQYFFFRCVLKAQYFHTSAHIHTYTHAQVYPSKTDELSAFENLRLLLDIAQKFIDDVTGDLEKIPMCVFVCVCMYVKVHFIIFRMVCGIVNIYIYAYVCKKLLLDIVQKYIHTYIFIHTGHYV